MSGKLLKKSERKRLAQKRYEALAMHETIPPEPWRRLRFKWQKAVLNAEWKADGFTTVFTLKIAGHTADIVRNRYGRWLAMVDRELVLNQGRCSVKEGKYHGPWPEETDGTWAAVFLRRRDAKRMVEAYLSQQIVTARLRPWTNMQTYLASVAFAPMLGAYAIYGALKRAG